MRHLNVLWILEVAQWLPGQISLPIPAKPLHQELMMRLLPNRYHAMLENFLHCEVANALRLHDSHDCAMVLLFQLKRRLPVPFRALHAL